jgi:hypothetical protein
MYKPPKCQKCRRKLAQRILFIVKGGCWKCGADMPIAFVVSESEIIAPYKFTREEIDLSAKNGVLLEERNSYGECELCNICPSCKVLTASPYVFNFAHLAIQDLGIPTGFYCSHCNRPFETKDLYVADFADTVKCSHIKPV